MQTGSTSTITLSSTTGTGGNASGTREREAGSGSGGVPDRAAVHAWNAYLPIPETAMRSMFLFPSMVGPDYKAVYK